jgi:hypothetical protein
MVVWRKKWGEHEQLRKPIGVFSKLSLILMQYHEDCMVPYTYSEILLFYPICHFFLRLNNKGAHLFLRCKEVTEDIRVQLIGCAPLLVSEHTWSLNAKVGLRHLFCEVSGTALKCAITCSVYSLIFSTIWIKPTQWPMWIFQQCRSHTQTEYLSLLVTFWWQWRLGCSLMGWIWRTVHRSSRTHFSYMPFMRGGRHWAKGSKSFLISVFLDLL